VFAESELGAGTTFYVYLPRVEESAEELSPVKSQQSEAGGCETVLLVEDEESVRELVRLTLASRGYNVLEAENGESGLRIAESFKEHIDILITDVVMPGFGGRELARKLLLLRPSISVLYLSGYTEDAVVTQGALGPRTAFLQKPFTLQNLAKKVREVLLSRSVPPPAPASMAKSASN
jgi:CheY-like chemotaxis protein